MSEEKNSVYVLLVQHDARVKAPARISLTFWLTVWCMGGAASAVAFILLAAFTYVVGDGGFPVFSWPFFVTFICLGGFSFAYEIWKTERNGGGAKGTRP